MEPRGLAGIDASQRALPEVPITTLDAFTAVGGLDGLAAAKRLGPDGTIDLIDAAGIRGRGGAGFPTGRKWRSLQSAITLDDAGFVVVNAAEGEPGTFKDRSLLRRNPFLVLEGALIAAHTLGARRVVVATKQKFTPELAALRAAVEALNGAHVTGTVAIEIVEGPDQYLFGEETAMLEVIEGEDPLPRQMAPYDYGLFTTSPQLGWSAGLDDSPTGPTSESSNPALVNNVETYAHVALVCRLGPEWYRSMGTEASPGPTIVTITGDVVAPVVVEVEMGTLLSDVIDRHAGGVAGAEVKAVLSGVSNPVLLGAGVSSPITYEHLSEAGGGLGSAGFIVFNEQRNMVDVAYQVLRFLHVESCGQCNPCKTGTADMAAGLEELVRDGRDTTGVMEKFVRRIETVTDSSRCYLPRQAQILLTTLLQRYPADLQERLIHPGDATIALPKLIDIVDGVAIHDPQLMHRRPDWTVAESPVWLRS